jgi:hypothetical protein
MVSKPNVPGRNSQHIIILNLSGLEGSAFSFHNFWDKLFIEEMLAEID